MKAPLDIIYDRNPHIISRNLVIFCSAFIKKKKLMTALGNVNYKNE